MPNSKVCVLVHCFAGIFVGLEPLVHIGCFKHSLSEKGVRSTGRPDIRPIHSRRYLSHPGFPRGSSQSGPRFCRCGCLWVKELGSASLLRRTSPARVASETRLSPVSRGPHGPAPWRRSRSVQKHRIVPLRPRFAIRRCPQSQANRHVQPTETRAQAQP
jgi:hypothetical protein